MYRVFLGFIFLLYNIYSFSQKDSNEVLYNLSFENVKDNTPIHWSFSNNLSYEIKLDSLDVKKGKYATSIEYKTGNVNFRSIQFKIPHHYKGKQIKLTGYIKTENVTNGYAGLWMRIDPYISSDFMENRGIKGTTKWKKYEIDLNLGDENIDEIYIGALLSGKGKMWVDDLKLSIDGKDILTIKPFEKEVLAADTDKEFDAGSRIILEKLGVNEIQNLKMLCLIWGFLKYYHPNIAKGNYNWDYELFRVLPRYVHSENIYQRDSILINWINNLGQFFTGNKEFKSDTLEIKLEPDLNWINSTDISRKLSDLLLKIKISDRQNEHYYIELENGASNPRFKNENPYYKMDYNDIGYRLLSLFKYWNIIQYYFPYRNLIEEDWKDILEEFIAKIYHANNETAYTLTLLELINKVGDTHANIYNFNKVLKNYFGKNNTALQVTFIDTNLIVYGYKNQELGKNTGLEKGDIITKINNIKTATIVAEKLKYYPASNYPTKLRDIAFDMLKTNDSTILIEYIRDGEINRKLVKTYLSTDLFSLNDQFRGNSLKKINGNRIVYIDNGTLKRENVRKYWKIIKKSKTLIIDLRNYPTDDALFEFGKYLMPKRTDFVKTTSGSVKNPGLFYYKKVISIGRKNKHYYKGRICILVNEETQSASEFVAMAYKVHPNAVVIGSTTAGADGNVSQFYLPGGIFTMISGIGIYYPDKTETQKVGIVPDIIVKPTMFSIKNGEDVLIEKAIKLTNENVHR